jgi:hypothetical protein
MNSAAREQRNFSPLAAEFFGRAGEFLGGAKEFKSAGFRAENRESGRLQVLTESAP